VQKFNDIAMTKYMILLSAALGARHHKNLDMQARTETAHDRHLRILAYNTACR
jgi:hypothetical protein